MTSKTFNTVGIQEETDARFDKIMRRKQHAYRRLSKLELYEEIIEQMVSEEEEGNEESLR